MAPELQTFLIAMTPMGELRASIPVALEVYGLPIWSVYLFSVLGNLVPVVFILLFFEVISNYLSHRFPFFNKFLVWLFERTRKNHNNKFERWKEFALVTLVAIPLPFTGAWTGSICAFVFGIPIKKALPLIFIGIMLAGITVTLISLGILSLK